MTASDHILFIFQNISNQKNEEIRDQIVEYADWSL